MPFDLATAKPAEKSGFDLATAKPVDAKPWSPFDGKSGGVPVQQTAQDVQRGRELAAPERTWRDDNVLGNVMGLPDAGLGVLSSILTPPASVAGGAVKKLFNGGTLEQNANDVAERIAYRPATGTGEQILRGVGKATEPLMALGMGDLNMLGGAAASASPSVRNLAAASRDTGVRALAPVTEVATKAGSKVLDLAAGNKKSTLAGVGAAATEAERLRMAAADQLPIPMGGLMTKGMRTRAKPDIQFEQIAAKDPELGEGLRNRTVEINQAALRNFDAFAEATGAEGQGLRPTGKVVNDYLIKRVKNAKEEIRKAYNDAAESVEGKTPADTGPLRAYLNKYDAEAKSGNAPVINTVRSILDELDPQGTGKIPLKDFNEIRERVGKISKDGSPNAPYRKELQDLVDNAVEENGGPGYRSARRMYENYQNEFKNAEAIDRLLRTKPGSKDRATALEDVVTKSTLDAPSTDAVRQVKTTLTRKQDPEGLQAWKELQGETARQIKERVTKASALNEGGAREVSPAQLDKIVRELDADGRLDVVFGKQGAQQWRDLRDTVIEMKTIPAGTVSSSGTAEVLAGLLDTVVSGSTGLPLPVASALNFGVKRVKKGIKSRKIERALNPDGEP